MSAAIAGTKPRKDDNTMSAATSNVDAKNGPAQTLKYSEDEIKHVPLGDVFVDWDWNSRSKANVIGSAENTEDREAPGIAGLMFSIKSTGQDEPVVLRRVQTGTTLGGHKTDKPWELVAGFRRYEAITALNASEQFRKEAADAKVNIVPNTPNGTIRAVVRDLDAKRARSLNVRENTARNNMTTPDLTYAVREMVLAKADAKQISTELGISHSYATMLSRVAKNLDKRILMHWRNGGEFEGKALPPVRLKVTDLLDLVARGEKAAETSKAFDQAKEYEKLLNGTAGKAKKDKQWLEAAVNKAVKHGEMLGLLHHFGFLKVTGKVSFYDIIAGTEQIPTGTLPVRGSDKKMTQKQAQRIADAAEEAFNMWKDGPPAPEEIEADEGEE